MTATATAITARRDALLAEIEQLIEDVSGNLQLVENELRQVAIPTGRVNELIEDSADNLVHALRLSDRALELEELLK